MILKIKKEQRKKLKELLGIGTYCYKFDENSSKYSWDWNKLIEDLIDKYINDIEYKREQSKNDYLYNNVPKEYR